MKDKLGRELAAGDFVKDDWGDLSKIKSFIWEDQLFSIPIATFSKSEVMEDGFWHIDAKYVLKLSEEEALVYALKGKL